MNNDGDMTCRRAAESDEFNIIINVRVQSVYVLSY